MDLPLVDKVRLEVSRPGTWDFMFGIAIGEHRTPVADQIWAPGVTYEVPTPENLTATVTVTGTGSFTFSWAEPDSIVGQVEYAIADIYSVGPLTFRTLPGSTTSKVYSTPAEGLTYRFHIRFIDRFGNPGLLQTVDAVWHDAS